MTADSSERLWKTSLSLRWGVLSALGLGAGVVAGILLLGPLEVLVGMLLVVPAAFTVSGAILGASQWFAVRYLARAGWWIALSAIGLAAGLTAGTVAIEMLGGWVGGGPVRMTTASRPALAVAFLGLGGVAGLGLGGAQWLLLRRRFDGGGRWISANGLALALGAVVGFGAAELAVGGVRSPLGAATLLTVAAVSLALVTGRVLESHARDAARAFRLAGPG